MPQMSPISWITVIPIFFSLTLIMLETLPMYQTNKKVPMKMNQKMMSTKW